MLPSTICAPSPLSSSGVIALTVPYVPTGMNTGVSTTPRAQLAAGRAAQRRRVPGSSKFMPVPQRDRERDPGSMSIASP